MQRPKFSMQQTTQDFTSKIRVVVDQFDCSRHDNYAPVGIPCFHLRMDSRDGYYAGICNVRALKLYNGVPRPTKFPKIYQKETR